MQEGVVHITPVLGLCSHVGLCYYWTGNAIWPGWYEQSRWHIIMLLLSLLTDTPRLSLAAWQGCSHWSVPSLPSCSSLSSWHWRDLWKETPSGQVLLSFDVKTWGLRWFLANLRTPVHGPRWKTAVILHVPHSAVTLVLSRRPLPVWVMIPWAGKPVTLMVNGKGGRECFPLTVLCGESESVRLKWVSVSRPQTGGKTLWHLRATSSNCQ